MMGTLFIFLTVGIHLCDGLTQFPPQRITTATSGTTWITSLKLATNGLRSTTFSRIVQEFSCEYLIISFCSIGPQGIGCEYWTAVTLWRNDVDMKIKENSKGLILARDLIENIALSSHLRALWCNGGTLLCFVLTLHFSENFVDLFKLVNDGCVCLIRVQEKSITL